MNPSSHLAQSLRSLRQVADTSRSIFDDIDPDSKHGKAICEAFVCFEQLRRIADVLEHTKDLDGFPGRLRRIDSAMNRIRTQQAGFHADFHELATACRVQRALQSRGWEAVVAFDEPDVVVSQPCRGKYGLACKRPTSISKVASHIRDGVKQLEKAGIQGAVVIDIEGVLHHDSEERKPVLFVCGHECELAGVFQDVLDKIQRTQGRQIWRLLQVKEALFEVVFCGLATGFVQRKHGAVSYSWTWQVRAFEKPQDRPHDCLPCRLTELLEQVS